jgi:hypothetical protein
MSRVRHAPPCDIATSVSVDRLGRIYIWNEANNFARWISDPSPPAARTTGRVVVVSATAFSASPPLGCVVAVRCASSVSVGQMVRHVSVQKAKEWIVGYMLSLMPDEISNRVRSATMIAHWAWPQELYGTPE